MRVATVPFFTVPLFALLTLSACAGGGAEVESPGPVSPSSATDTDDLEALYMARTDSARQDFTEADVRFMTGMIGHHAQALVMSGFAPANGASPTIRTLAARIINAQQDEIQIMQQWLRDRGEPVPEVHIADGRLMIHGAGHGAMMPGMLTDEQMRELEAAQGREFDRLFLTYMVQHHRGAVTMVHGLFATDGAAQGDVAFKLASDIQVDQITEINRMELMLEEMSASGRSR
jgi:uncharacterized protein (DUF305 family)